MVYIRTANRRGRTIQGVILGGVAVIISVCFILAAWPEVPALLGQKEPDRISVHDAVNLRGIRWVAIADGQWHCAQAITIKRKGVRMAEVPITGAIEGEVLVAALHGDPKCAERTGTALTGVVGSKVIFSSRGALRRWGRSWHRVAVIYVGASPRFALIILLVAVAVAVLAIAVFGYHLRDLLRSGRKSAPLPSYEPIQ